MSRKNRGQDLTTASDGLSALSVAEHAKDKEDTLRNITDIFTQAMRKKWPGKLYYVDPFCGPGKCLIKTSEEETDGSPIIAAGVPFSRFYFADEDERCIEALRKRLQGMNLSGKQVRYYTGEANETIGEILRELPPERESLGLALLDPWGWDFSFESLKKLTRGRRLDILVNFNIGHMKRTWREPNPKMDSFLNISTDHREFFKTAAQDVPDARTLLDHYEKELEKIGYCYIADDIPVTNSNNTPLYHIIFGSKNKLGKKLRDEVSKKTASGQFKLGIL